MPEHDLPVPRPEKKLSDYTDGRIRQSLQFAEQYLKYRRLTPNSARMVAQYKKASKAALLADEDSIKKTHIVEIRTFDKLFSQTPFLRQKIPEPVDLQQEMLKLRRLMYLARYGDYLNAALKKIRYVSGEIKTTGFEALSAEYQWSDTAAAIRDERKEDADWNMIPKNETIAGLRVTTAVAVVREGLGIRPEPIFWAIQQYAERNTAFHTNLRTLIDKCAWAELAVLLKRDLNELPSVIFPKDEQDLKLMRALLESIRDEWFDIAGPDPSNLATWIPAAKAREWQGILANREANKQNAEKKTPSAKKRKPKHRRKTKKN
ncbi:hypothetical protein MMC17_000950 [Xylographa soralifera]|nr:hypothetical protein [Xylographa soralifera]